MNPEDRQGPVAPQSSPARKIGPYQQSLIESEDRIREAVARRRAAARRRRVLVLIGALVGVAALVVGAVLVLGERAPAPAAGPTAPAAPRSCADPTTVTVSAPSGIAAALSAATEALASHDDGPCAAFDIQASGSALVAASLGEPSRPDAWVTESDDWVQRAKALSGLKLTRGPVFASSGLVAAMTKEHAAALGSPPTWADVLGPKGRTRVAPPTLSSTGLLALAGAKSAMPAKDFTAVVAALAKPTTGLGLAQVAASKTPLGLVVTEAELLGYNTGHEQAPLVGVAPTGGAPAIDYALTVVSDDAAVKALVERLGAFLATDEAREVLAAHGYRTPKGPTPKAPGELLGTVTTAALPPASVLDDVTSAWADASPHRQVLLALDVSGSMLDRVGADTRLTAMTRAVRAALAAAPGHLRVSLWAHGLHIGDRGDDFAQLAGYGALSDRKQTESIEAGLSRLTKLVAGGSGLYDSILATYTAAGRSFAAGHDNTVVLITDGPNEDDYGFDLAGAKQRLTQLQDPKKPVRLVIIGLGPKPDVPAMKELAAITKGSYVAAADAEALAVVLDRALGIG
jgi:ABC-type molybdate transport system substrate-binding protein/Mg-chelatase subunit ChlD